MKPFFMTDKEKEQIKFLYVEQKQSLYMIANTINRDPSSIHRWLRKWGLRRNRSCAQKLANTLGRGQGTINAGANNGMWRGGRRLTPFGYIRIKVFPENPLYCMAAQDGCILEHRLAMAKHLNRPLNHNEIVHHLNGIRDDNRISNLALVTCRNHPTKTLTKLFQKRIRDLEAELAQQKLKM